MQFGKCLVLQALVQSSKDSWLGLSPTFPYAVWASPLVYSPRTAFTALLVREFVSRLHCCCAVPTSSWSPALARRHPQHLKGTSGQSANYVHGSTSFACQQDLCQSLFSARPPLYRLPDFLISACQPGNFADPLSLRRVRSQPLRSGQFAPWQYPCRSLSQPPSERLWSASYTAPHEVAFCEQVYLKELCPSPSRVSFDLHP